MIIGLSGFAVASASAPTPPGATPGGSARLSGHWTFGQAGYPSSYTSGFSAGTTTTTAAPISATTASFRFNGGRHKSSPTTSTTTTVAPTTTTTVAPTTTTTTTLVGPAYPIGTANASEPSGMAPPSAGALSGYTQTYVSDFTGSSLPSGWYAYSGQPGSDPGAQFGTAHVVVGGGLLQLNTWQDPAYGNNWVTGGLCHCGHAQTYGAYFVRSRVTGSGPTQVMLLWPSANVWPPEVDFNESSGATNATSATVHWGSTNNQDQRKLTIDLTQWHTWGVVWTPTSITYTVDGKVWGTITNASEIPTIAMTLDLQQQTWCSSGWACPSAPQSMLVDWVAEYSAG
jgi:hypothetical protein